MAVPSFHARFLPTSWSGSCSARKASADRAPTSSCVYLFPTVYKASRETIAIVLRKTNSGGFTSRRFRYAVAIAKNTAHHECEGSNTGKGMKSTKYYVHRWQTNHGPTAQVGYLAPTSTSVGAGENAYDGGCTATAITKELQLQLWQAPHDRRPVIDKQRRHNAGGKSYNMIHDIGLLYIHTHTVSRRLVAHTDEYLTLQETTMWPCTMSGTCSVTQNRGLRELQRVQLS